MQRMKTDTTTLGIENWICQQMIKIDYHRCQHNEPGKTPT